ncbi:hypothetical protein NDU88_003843 [Pleurodeles waltl]|uniref:Uncharacterized protein n=1 Tax=Pleurodeles waltl TaxID=8319 RepID=A0AAV7LI75_PLEWA|nr:hypothetical protein NDU88_003843 [Pleurodeles waltl]
MPMVRGALRTVPPPEHRQAPTFGASPPQPPGEDGTAPVATQQLWYFHCERPTLQRIMKGSTRTRTPTWDHSGFPGQEARSAGVPFPGTEMRGLQGLRIPLDGELHGGSGLSKEMACPPACKRLRGIEWVYSSDCRCKNWLRRNGGGARKDAAYARPDTAAEAELDAGGAMLNRDRSERNRRLPLGDGNEFAPGAV